MPTMTKGIETSKNQIGLFKKMRASVCKHCPMCNQARKNPDSIIGKLLHHPFHSNHCPVWKAYEEVYGDQKPSHVKD